MKKPKLDRCPKLSSAIAQPQMMMTSGVRQVPAPGEERRSPAIAISTPRCLAQDLWVPESLDEVNAFAWKTQEAGWKNCPRRAALQNRREQFWKRREQSTRSSSFRGAQIRGLALRAIPE